MNESELVDLIKAAVEKKITWINLSDHKISILPPEIELLSEVRMLDLSDNYLSYIPPQIGKLRNLTQLYLGRNQLVDLPMEIGKIPLLEKLDVSGNKLTELPKEVGQLILLRYLDISYNQIAQLPSEISQLSMLRELTSEGNPIEKPPIEIVNRGIRAIRNYFWQLEAAGVDVLYEAKLVIVGEPGAGKTTLAKKIKEPEYDLQENEKTTEGIEVSHWAFLMDDEKPFRVNIWDFGGQEIYHSTHQFFLTKRTLYAIVADTRKEDTDFFYWLNVVEMLSDRSPTLIIKNEKQDRQRQINERRLRGQFINLEKTLATNFATNRGLVDVISDVKHYIRKLPHIGAPLPKTWVQVREILEHDSRNYITLDEFIKICHESNFTNLKDILQLSGFLHDLGVCIHFQDDPLLKKLVILKPEWGTSAVYKVLDDNAVINNFGRFRRSDLEKIWYEPQFVGMQDELLQLMINFKLCFKLEGFQEQYIAPQLLTEDQPVYKCEEAENLLMRYEYDFMPKGIITRLIVAMHRLIAYREYVWKSGVVLNKSQTWAEIIEYYEKREISIRVVGPDKKSLSTIINYELEKIHSLFPHLKYSLLIPCNCTECKNSQEPHFYTYERLSKRIMDKRFEIECPNSYEMVDIIGLFGDIVQADKSLQKLEEKRRLLLHPNRLYNILMERFDEEELRDICFNLGLDYEMLPGRAKGSKSKELILYLERRNRLGEMIEVGQKMRSDIVWEVSEPSVSL